MGAQANMTLAQRGIETAARAAGWVDHALYGRAGWLYPVQSSKVPGHSRWKALDGGANGKPKYLWQPNEAEERPRYYFVNGIKDAISRDNGRVYLASGEPDVLVYASAGAHNAICWFGERSVPETVVSDFKALGVTQVVCAPDRDTTGSGAAQEVEAAFAGTGIQFVALQLPGASDSHYDINALWIEVGFDTDAFWQRFKALEVLNVERKNADIDWDTSYEAWCLDVERAAVSAWKVDANRKGEWSRKLFSSPLRKDSDPSARWEYAVHGFKDFGTDEFYNTHQVAELVGAQTWEAYKAELIADATAGPLLYGDLRKPSPVRVEQPKSLATKAHEANSEIRVVTSDEAMMTVLAWLEGKVPPDEPIVAPYPAMHQLGGMARFWERRKLVYVIGAAGMGKTAFMETGADNLRKRGLSVIYWGPEWSPEEVQMKAIARYGGPSFEVQRADHIWKKQALRGIPESKRSGAPLSPDNYALASHVACTILEWPGKAWYIDKANVSIETVALKVIETAEKSRALGQDPACWFVDYLQKARLPAAAGRWNELEEKANVVSYTVIEANLAGVIASQVGKDDSRQLRKGNKLDHASAQGLSDQLCNLYITLNPVFDKEGHRLEKGVIGVEKNSSGYAPAEVTVKTALYRALWTDEVTHIDKNTESREASFIDKAANDD